VQILWATLYRLQHLYNVHSVFSHQSTWFNNVEKFPQCALRQHCRPYRPMCFFHQQVSLSRKRHDTTVFYSFFVMVRTTNNGGGMTLSEKFLLYFSHKAASNKNSKSLNLFICSLLWMSLQNITLLTSKRFVAFRLEQKNFWSDGLQRFWHVQQNKNTFSDCVAPKFVRPCLAE